MNNRLAITTLNELTFQINSEPVTGFSSRKAEALLVYLAVEKGIAHRRESLFTLLWPGMPETSARNNLRQVLYALRKILPEVTTTEDDDTVPLLLTDRQTVQINPAAALNLDVNQIDQWLEVVQVHEHMNLAGCEDCLQLLEKVVSRYRGSFLANFYLEDSSEFEDWAEANREDYRRKALGALETLAEIVIQKGNYETAGTYAEGQLKIDPLRESAYRQLMELYSKSGQRAEALRTYQRCARILDIELGTTPSRETTALYEIISGEDLRGAAGTPREGFIRGYEIREHLGSGHTGMVYRAYQPVIHRDVAVKVIAPQFANHPDFIRRFEVEAQLIARLEHPYIVPLYDYWRDPSGAYLVMRWLKGGNLQDDLTRGPWMPEPAVQLIDQISAALSLAHRQGVVHCDIKPANILLDEESNAYLTDFGIAILTGPLGQLSHYMDFGVESNSSASLGYTSPEVARGLETSPLADVYSLGVVLFELLTAVHPFPGLEGEALIQKHLNAPLPSVLKLRAELPAEVDAVIQRATQKVPAKRFPDVEALAQAFRLAINPETTTPPEVPAMLLEVRNPYKGLRPFQEADSTDFFGRDQLIQCLLDRLTPPDDVTPGAQFLAVVGPSGSGKSSVVKAGLIPAIRQGRIPGSERWFVVEMTPGSHPLEELEAALLHIAIQTPENLLMEMQSEARGLVRVLRKALPGVEDEVLLVIDQFEELFTLVDDESERNHFLETLAAAVRDPHSPLRVLLTLRADFYDRPLQHIEFGALMQQATEVVLPLTPEELERAICGPAAQIGVQLEGALVARIIQELGDQPGELPLLEYALTELFERRDGRDLTIAAYEASGGVLGALGRRAEEIYTGLEESERDMARQIFLRLVTLGEGIEDTRRRVLRSEIEALARLPNHHTSTSAGDGRSSVVSAVMDCFGRYRLLTFDHDPATRTPTVEVAHEALLREWPRLRNWLDESRDEVRMQRMLGAATQEWLAAKRDPGFLLRGTRLDQFALWVDETDIVLTKDERAYLAASLAERKERQAAEVERQAHETQLKQRSRRFLQALVGVFAMAAVVAILLSGVAFNQRGIAQENAATATYAQGEALVLADSRATQQSIAENEAEQRATQQAIAEDEANARAVAEAQALEDRDRALIAEQEALKQASIGLASQALAEMQTANSERGVLLALAALEEYPYTPQAEAALGHAVQESLPYKNMIDEEGQNLDGHWVDWSPDGKKIALGSATNHKGEHGAVVFDVESGEVVLVLPWVIQIEEDPKTNNKCSVQQINWSPDGTRLALVANNNNQENLQPWCYSFQIYDASSGELLLDLDTQGEFAVDWSPDGGQLLTGGEDGQVKIWDAKTGDLILELEGHDKTDFEIYTDTSDRVVAARFSPNGDYAATFSVGGVAHIWDIANGKVMQTLEHPPEIIARNLTYPGMNKIGLTWSPDGRYLATAWYDGLGRVWDIETGNVVQILAGHTGNMIGIDWSPDGVYLLTQGIDTSARLWVASTGQMLLKLPARGYGNAAWSTDGQKVATPTPEGLLTWDTFTLPPVISTSAPLQSIGGGIAHWSLDGNLFVLGNSTEQVFSWSDLQSSWSIAPIDGFFEISPDSSRVVAANGHNFQTAQVIDLYTGEVLAELKSSPPEPGGMYFTSSWSKDGTRVASGTYPVYWTVIWDPETGEELARSEIVDGFMMQAQFSPDGRVVASPAVFTEGNSPVYLIDTETGETLRELPSEDGWSCVAMWSPDGKILAVGYRNGVIKLWDTETWLEKETFQLHQSSVWDLNWSPNGQRIISGDVDTSVIVIWDVESGAIIAKWDMGGLLEGGFNDVDWSPDGQFVLMHGTGGYPFIKRAWQSTEDLIDYAYECCVWRELSAEERVQFGLPEKPSD